MNIQIANKYDKLHCNTSYHMSEKSSKSHHLKDSINSSNLNSSKLNIIKLIKVEICWEKMFYQYR